MADLTPTAAQLALGSDAGLEDGIAGEAIAQGDWLYQKAADSRLWKADANAAAAEAAGVVGQAHTAAAAAGQPVRYVARGTAVQGAAAGVVRGTVYVLSANAGKACPAADLAGGHRVVVLGVGDDANGIKLQIHRSGITV